MKKNSLVVQYGTLWDNHITTQLSTNFICKVKYLFFSLMHNIPPITRNLIIINIIVYLIQSVMHLQGIELTDWLGLHFIMADQFHFYQLISYMFLHGSITHLFFNMFSLWMFGGLIERTMGMKRFLAYYFICGIGAGLCQEVWQAADYYINHMQDYTMVNLGQEVIPMGLYLNSWTTIGASGACYGVLLAFGMLYPNERIMLLLPPIPMKAKYFVAGYAAIELISAYTSNDNVAHFAHLGGMLFGWFMIWLWSLRNKKQSTSQWEQWSYPQQNKKHNSLKNKVKHIFSHNTTTEGNAHHTATRENDYDYNIRSKQEEQRMDEILDKIKRSGYDSLTSDEKRELFRISRK